jgi:hypothetical protein
MANPQQFCVKGMLQTKKQSSPLKKSLQARVLAVDPFF